MSELTFGRTVRSRRTKLGLSQTQLGDLVGRSSTAVRSWERDQSQPTDVGVLTALSAVLGVDEVTLFEKAGLSLPEVETSPTVEQALATLNPVPDVAEPETDPEELHSSDLDFLDLEPEVGLDPEEGPVEPEPAPPLEIEEDRTPVKAIVPAYVAPPEPFLVTTAVPPRHEPSYMEDRTQRQLYRVRNLATIVVLVALGIAFLWAFSESLGAVGDWWDEFFGSLRL